VADRWIKGEDGAQAYGCKITWIRHHAPELIVKDGWSEVERISLERMRSAQEIDRLMQSRGFKHTDQYREKLRSKRDVTFESTDEIDIYYLQPDGSEAVSTVRHRADAVRVDGVRIVKSDVHAGPRSTLGRPIEVILSRCRRRSGIGSRFKMGSGTSSRSTPWLTGRCTSACGLHHQRGNSSPLARGAT
jgi:hypothetical protein